MLFKALQTPNSPLGKVFEEAAKTFSLPSVLPHDIGALHALLAAQQNAHAAELQTAREEAHAYILRMLEQAALARHRMFGASSEQMSAQSRLFDEAEVLAQASTEAHDTAAIADIAAEDGATKSVHKRARGKRAPLAAGLARVDVVHDLPEADRTCPCGSPMVLIGQDISEQLDIVPMQVRVIRNIRNRYGCPGSQHAPVTAPLPGAAFAQEQCQRGLSGHAVHGQVCQRLAVDALL